MWIMTSFGILMPSIRPANTIPAGDNRTMQIRTRRSRDLEILRNEYMKETLGPTVYMRNTDYEYRAYCTPEAWADAMARMSLDIDYTKFKPTTERYHDSQLHGLYNTLWSTIFSKLSTTQHQHEYWGMTSRVTTRKSVKHGKCQKNRLPQWWDELPDVNDDGFNDVLDSYLERYEKITLDIDTSDVDGLTEPPYVTPTGQLDHSDCDHAHTRNARRRCRNKWTTRVK